VFWLGVPLIFQELTLGSHGLCWLLLVNPGPVFGSHGLWLVVQLGIPRGYLSLHHLCSVLALESLNEVRIILTRWHRVPEQGDNYTSQGR
jgi:hypothetical protein